MKGKTTICKAVIALALSMILLISALMPITAFGTSSGNSEYVYYSVKTSDTLDRIASSYGVTTGDILALNAMEASDSVSAGQIIKIPISGTGSDSYSSVSTISLKASDADLKSVLSLIADCANYTILYTGTEGQTVTIDLEDVTPLAALDYVLRKVSMSYIQSGNMLIVGDTSTLNSSYID